jgi:hypothetical protein
LKYSIWRTYTDSDLHEAAGYGRGYGFFDFVGYGGGDIEASGGTPLCEGFIS